MDLKQIEKLMMAMRRFGTKRLSIKQEGVELELERESENDVQVIATKDLTSVPQVPTPAKLETKEKKKEEGRFVQSPMVGTFYLAPSPEDKPFVKVGDKIDKTTVICIIEAMKVMNEIKAGVEGFVKEVLVENGHPVEFGTKLFRIE